MRLVPRHLPPIRPVLVVGGKAPSRMAMLASHLPASANGGPLEHAPKPNIIVVGGSYAGTWVAQCLAAAMHATHRVLLIEKNTHFQHLFAFPRFAVTPGHEHLAFIPFVPDGYRNPVGRLPQDAPLPVHLIGAPQPTPLDALAFVQGSVAEVHTDRVVLEGDEAKRRGREEIPFEYLVLATGTRLPPPGTLSTQDKNAGVKFFQRSQTQIEEAQKITIIGGGAVGVQMATDIKEKYPTKTITLVHSRAHLMNAFHPKLHALLMARADELGIDVVLEDRARIPQGGFPVDAGTFEVALKSGRTISTDLAILCTGQQPLSAPLLALSADILTASGHARVLPTMQLDDPRFAHIFALGDVADTGAQKSARAAFKQGLIASENIWRAHRKEAGALAEYKPDPAGIHMSLGFVHNIVFRNPAEPGGEPSYSERDDGKEDLGVMRFWKMRAPGVTDYHS